MKTNRIGVFSGTFDPMHIGHIEVCLVARGALELEQVLVMIEKDPRRKTNITDYKHRHKIAELSLQNSDTINLFETKSDNITFDQTLKQLNKKFHSYIYVMLIGSDMLKYVANWPDFKTWASKHELAVVLRENKEKKEVTRQLKTLQEKFLHLETHILPAVWAPVSSSKVKQEIAAHNYSDLVHRDALAYIKQHKLYSSAASK